MITKQERIKVSKLIESKAIATLHLTQAAVEIMERAAIAYVRASDELEAYLDSLVVPEDTTAANDGWIKWGGGDCPVAAGTCTEVRLRDGAVCTDNSPETWVWGHRNNIGDIIAYRVASE